MCDKKNSNINSLGFYSNRFPETEKKIIKELDELFDSWENQINKWKESNDINNSKKLFFVRDGIFPYYSFQKIKVLFIGKESLSMQFPYIGIIDEFKANKPRGKENKFTLNSDPFSSKLFYISYALQKNIDNYDSLPWASNIVEDSFTSSRGISFAVMNLSKFDNLSDSSYSADLKLMTSFFDASGKDDGYNKFMKKEIEIINPDIIVGANLHGVDYWLEYWWSGNKKHHDNCGIDSRVIPSCGGVFDININGKNIPYVDLFHFSGRKPRIDNEYTMTSYYIKPILQVANKYGFYKSL